VNPADPFGWMKTLMEGTGRAQAAAAADALRRVNAPVVAALQRQHEAAEALATLAEQMGWVARQQMELTAQLQAALKPYQSYVEWLDQAGR
jgi:broad specificity phosphatase PhoE